MAETTQKTNPVKDEQESTHKGARTRSPAYPGINLKTAITRARELYEQDKLNSVPITIAVKRWGFKEKSSGGLIATAALKSFGLIKDSGTGKDRRVQISEEARRILLDQRPESTERDETIKQAALKPKIHQLLWKKWGADLPPDDTFSHELIFELNFNENSVKDFIKEYRDTIRFAKLTSSDTLSSNEEDKNEITVGDYVQWESQGVYQFTEPSRVTGFSDEGSYVFVEGTNTGIPFDQLLKVDPPPGGKSYEGASVPPINPSFKPAQAKPGMNNATLPLDEGPVIIQWPTKMSQESYEDFKTWLDLIARKAKRAVEKPEDQE